MSKFLPLILLVVFFGVLVTFGLLAGIQAGKNRNLIESDFGMIYRNINQNLPKSTGFSDDFFVKNASAVLKDTVRIGYFYITDPNDVIVFSAAKNKTLLGMMKKPGQKLIVTSDESSGIFALDFDTILENAKIKSGYHLISRGYFFYYDEISRWIPVLFIFSLIVLFLFAIPLLVILLGKKTDSSNLTAVISRSESSDELDQSHGVLQDQQSPVPTSPPPVRSTIKPVLHEIKTHSDSMQRLTTIKEPLEEPNQYLEIPMPDRKIEAEQMHQRLMDRGIPYEPDQILLDDETPLIPEFSSASEDSWISDVPDLTSALPAGASDPEGLYSNRTGFGWEAYLAGRLDNELSRSAAFDQDLVACVLCYDKDNVNDADFRSFAARIEKNFEYRDLIFEFENNKFFIILPNINSEQGVRRIENFFSFLEKNFPDHYLKVSAGLSSRHGRLVSASRLIKEAVSALSRSVPFSEKSIIAFKPDPEKYRNFLAGIG